MKFIDLFAGIGGIRIPFDEIGYNCVFTSEWDKFSQQTYKDNFGECPDGDITKIKVADIPKHNIILAGFPCQPFSNAGLKKGFQDTRGTLFFYIEKIIAYHKPELVFLENVKGFKSHDKGNTFKIVKESLEKLDYHVFDKIFNAKDFGVPQNRERIYIIAFNKKKVKNYNEFVFPTPSYKKVKLGDILEEKVDEKYTISDKLWAGHKRRKEAHKLKGNGFGYSLFDANSAYTSTMSARYYKDGSEILIRQKNKNPRKITPREASRLQGFPKDFVLTVSNVQCYKQFGNSVAVPVIRAIAKKIEKVLST
ncbi:DNA cytosine methyltransferase [Patescibacteria group bacterium]|nr:DNA cytosine methyltransferase [Patescibacteria group bacterium]MBU1721875.1 DNA cytosine methyltransferase [Patescibacteria group bacterium]MBU1901333.1 DNA cytosine methyltransferase [Patescibacteria group bacterium]